MIAQLMIAWKIIAKTMKAQATIAQTMIAQTMRAQTKLDQHTVWSPIVSTLILLWPHIDTTSIALQSHSHPKEG